VGQFGFGRGNHFQYQVGTQGGGIPGTPGAGGSGFRLAGELLASNGSSGMLIILPLN